MDPYQYLERYHSMVLCDVGIGMLGFADVTRYISGEPSDGRAMYGKIVAAAAKARKLGSKLPALFTLPDVAGIPAAEEFSKPGLRRAFAGRGCPMELHDAVRLAVALRIITHPVSSSQFATKWFGQDCNAFVGNWLGISSSVAIFAYFLGYGSGSISGATASVYASRDWLPLKPVATPMEIRKGNVVITYGAPRGGKKHKHIALVQACTPMGGDKYNLSLAEWGRDGGIEKHRTQQVVTIESTWRHPQRKGTALLSFEDTGKQGVDNRFFLDHSSLSVFPARGWDVCGQWGI